MELTELVRLANLVLSVALMLICMLRIARDWPDWNHRERVVRVHLTAYLFVIAYGTIEAIAAGVDPGARIFLLFAVHASFLLALWRTRRDPVR